jgi:hypothetical protein
MPGTSPGPSPGPPPTIRSHGAGTSPDDVVAKVAMVAGIRRAPRAGILVEVEPEPVTPE